MTWKSTSVSEDGTHHILHGVPLYDARFDEVLKYHAPGLAPVKCGTQAWHIGVDGQAAYSHRFERTFGFYHERAAVITTGGWCHILPNGEPLYIERYAWCGNYQGGLCTVRTSDDKYFHIDDSGTPVYETRWAYAGDFRNGVAVVQRLDGLSTHIRADGSLLHGLWFVDLDVFHKGFARAVVHGGWTHINEAGTPLYDARYAMVEPFYNSQARVETHHGALLVIDEQGQHILTLRPAHGEPPYEN